MFCRLKKAYLGMMLTAKILPPAANFVWSTPVTIFTPYHQRLDVAIPAGILPNDTFYPTSQAYLPEVWPHRIIHEKRRNVLGADILGWRVPGRANLKPGVDVPLVLDFVQE